MVEILARLSADSDHIMLAERIDGLLTPRPGGARIIK